VKICRFLLPWQQGLVWHKVHFHSLCGRPVKPPIWRKNLDDISYTSWVIANFLLKFTIFGYYGNKGGSRKILNDSLWLADPQTPSFVKILGLILNASCVIVIFQFCVEISKFSLPWQQGLVWHKSIRQLNRQAPKTPYLAQESWWYLIHKLSYSQFSDKIYQFLLPCQQGWV